MKISLLLAAAVAFSTSVFTIFSTPAQDQERRLRLQEEFRQHKTSCVDIVQSRSDASSERSLPLNSSPFGSPSPTESKFMQYMAMVKKNLSPK